MGLGRKKRSRLVCLNLGTPERHRPESADDSEPTTGPADLKSADDPVKFIQPEVIDRQAEDQVKTEDSGMTSRTDSGPPTPSTQARLELITRQPGSRMFELTLPTTRIGRGIGNDLVLASESYASREHCLIEHLENRYRLRDLNSANGTYVNHVRVRETFLRHGDRILIGTMHMEFIQSQ